MVHIFRVPKVFSILKFQTYNFRTRFENFEFELGILNVKVLNKCSHLLPVFASTASIKSSSASSVRWFWSSSSALPRPYFNHIVALQKPKEKQAYQETYPRINSTEKHSGSSRKDKVDKPANYLQQQKNRKKLTQPRSSICFALKTPTMFPIHD